MSDAERFDPFSGTRVHIVASRQNRPNIPTDGCPFCVGGLEAPDEYRVKSFVNRWPALQNGICEVVLYSPKHDASFASLEPNEIKDVVDLWAERTTHLALQKDIEYVLVFENCGAQVGATIQHPHGQIYAFDHVPARQHRILSANWRPELDAGARVILTTENFVVYSQFAAIHPVSLVVAPRVRVGAVAALTDGQRVEFAEVLSRTFRALQNLFDSPPPYMMWITQVAENKYYSEPWMHMEIVSPWRATNVQRYIAAAEVSTEEYFNPVDPDDVAARMRRLVS
ncbi:MAG: DUF4931 domain-containing protein [Actinomycetota bacterium]